MRAHTGAMTKPTRVPITHFASAERASIEIIHRQSAQFQGVEIAPESLESLQNYVFILNRQRQIVFAGRNVRELVDGKNRKQLLGRRLGEALDCVHSAEEPSGCGTSVSCQNCAAIKAILQSLAGRDCSLTFRLTRFVGKQQESQRYLVMTMPFMWDDEPFVFLALADNAVGKKKEVIKRLFARQVSRLMDCG